ncbi:pyridoxine/pyridoxamine 5'-phosphate oxidase isoform X2 [Anabrus simplex]|uniref:pyridoxine/pyridoxamine 5'-phosphate oxidase isoform X2 n=1 Tax=Anabrus simplex TaxID=316456 RepID=UPI0034DD37A1
MDSVEKNGYTTPRESGLAEIKLKSEYPLDMFKEWHQEVKKSGHLTPDALVFSTTNREGRVTSRTVYLRRLESDGFVIMTDRRGRKARDLAECPQASIVFFWSYLKDGDVICSQVRAEGAVVELEPHQFQDLYDNEPLFCKIRSHLCRQGAPVEDWQEYKARHDELLQQWKQGENTLPMPDHFVAYKLIPDVMDFYQAWGTNIGDRRLFVWDKELEQWTSKRVQA